MLIEAARYLEDDLGVDLTKEVIMSAVDVSPMAFHMASIQLTLCNIPAVIFLGNGLSSDIEESCSDKVITRILADQIEKTRGLSPRSFALSTKALAHEGIIE